MPNRTIYFPEGADVFEAAAEIAADLGYVGKHGRGNIPQLLTAIVSGEVAIWLAPSIDAMGWAADALWDASYPGDGLEDLANALEAAVRRAAASDLNCRGRK